MTGLESNGYYINNDIFIGFPAYVGNLYFTVRIESVSNPQLFIVQRVYASPDGTARINISPILKSMFGDFGNSNSQEFKITRILSSNNASLTLQKTFIRGGVRSTLTNLKATANTFLNPAVKYPVFQGYPITFDYINGEYQINQIQQPDISVSLLDYRIPTGCNGTYIRFLNQMGGYSYWYFESFSNTESGDNLGGFINRNNQVDDLGNESNVQLKAYSKFPKEYVSLAKDLIVSGEIYIYENGVFTRIRTIKNSIEEDKVKRAYSVTLKFDIDYRFNPSSLWSN